MLAAKATGFSLFSGRFRASVIPMRGTSLAFFGKTYLLVGSILNFTQLSTRILIFLSLYFHESEIITWHRT